jgi:hypothetical protein
VRVFLQKVMLHLPGVVVAEPIGQLDLIERIGEQLVFAIFGPRTWQLEFIKNAEFHDASLLAICCAIVLLC